MSRCIAKGAGGWAITFWGVEFAAVAAPVSVAQCADFCCNRRFQDRSALSAAAIATVVFASGRRLQPIAPVSE